MMMRDYKIGDWIRIMYKGTIIHGYIERIDLYMQEVKVYSIENNCYLLHIDMYDIKPWKEDMSLVDHPDAIDLALQTNDKKWFKELNKRRIRSND